MSRWQELYNATMTHNYVCGYVHYAYGGLHLFDPETEEYKAVERESILEGASGEYHEDWVWFPNGISPNEKYLIMTADPSDMKYDYYFLLFDREEKQVLWELGFFNGDFDEPGPVHVADNGVSAIIQEDILFVVEPDGSLRFTVNPRDTGRLWRALAVSGDGYLFIRRDTTGESVWLYSGEGELLWKIPSDCHENGGYLAVSPNGKYVAYADHEGPHVVDPEGNVLFELPGDEKWYTPNYIDVADDGTIVYTIGNRIYYRNIEE